MSCPIGQGSQTWSLAPRGGGGGGAQAIEAQFFWGGGGGGGGWVKARISRTPGVKDWHCGYWVFTV